jgi:hypothetical protein
LAPRQVVGTPLLRGAAVLNGNPSISRFAEHFIFQRELNQLSPAFTG